MKTNVFHPKRQASCDVLFYPVTPVFFYFSDVTGPGGFREEETERKNVLSTLCNLSQSSTCCLGRPDVILPSKGAEKRQSRPFLLNNAVTLSSHCCLISSADEFIYEQVWAHSIVGTHAKPVKTHGNGSKNKNKLVLWLSGVFMGSHTIAAF